MKIQSKFIIRRVQFLDGVRNKRTALINLYDNSPSFYILKEEAKYIFSQPYRVNLLLLVEGILYFFPNNLGYILNLYTQGILDEKIKEHIQYILCTYHTKHVKIKTKKYEDRWTKILFVNINNEKLSEIQVTKYPFHDGIRVCGIYRCEVKRDIHCKNVFEAVRTVRQLYAEFHTN